MSRARAIARWLIRAAARRISRTIPDRLRTARDAGMSTAEYAIGTVAACAFAAVLYKVVTSTQILDLLSGVVSRALHVPF
ncbi:MAG TPA: DUF4244 domain-containing protein [Acidothermaceae bacterium]